MITKLIIFLVTYGAVLAVIFQFPMPLNVKFGMSLIAMALVMILSGGVWWAFTSVKRKYNEITHTMNCNAMVWRHPENTEEGRAVLELVNFGT